MTNIPSFDLHDGRAIPQLGFGTWQLSGAQATSSVREALAAGYRLIDTASAYENEALVGEGLRSSGVPREEIFVTTKLWNDQQGYDEALRGLEESLGKLQLDYVDLYLIHWPVPQADKYVDSWRALSRLREEGRAKSIGVSNFQTAHLQRLLDETGVVPVVNQIELHPQFSQKPLREFHARHRIVTESWSPLARGELVRDARIAGIAKRHGKTAAQVILRWHIEHGLVVIPKSSTPERIRENRQLFDFQLTREEVAELDGLETGRRIGPDPESFSGA